MKREQTMKSGSYLNYVLVFIKSTECKICRFGRSKVIIRRDS